MVLGATLMQKVFQVPKRTNGRGTTPAATELIGLGNTTLESQQRSPSPGESARSRDNKTTAIGFVVLGQAVFISSALLTDGSSVSDSATQGDSSISRLGWLILTLGCIASVALLTRSNGPRLSRLARNSFLALCGSQFLSYLFAGQIMSVNVLAPSVALIIVLERFPLLDGKKALELCFYASLLPVISSLTAWAMGFTWAVTEPGRRTPFPAFNARLAGVYAHPNALGPISAICIILCFAYRPRFKIIWITASAVALWASDSRTSIIILPIALLAMMIDRRKLPAIVRNASLLLGASAVILILFTTSFATSTIESSDTQTLNGRTQLWADALTKWSESPIVGMGPKAFDMTYRLQTGRDYAGQAHNQFLHTLSSEGSVGFLALCLFLYFVAKSSFRSRANTSSASIAVGIIVLATLLVESPLRATRWSPGLLVLSVVLVLCFAQNPPQVSGETVKRSQAL